MRKHIDRVTLRLAAIGIDIETLDFYHDPSKAAIRRAKHTLVSLGAMSRNGDITNIGRAMERFPVESSFARMLVEGESCSKPLQAKLAAIIAIQEVGGIVKGGTKYTGWRKLTKQTKSDLLAQYDVYLSLPDETTEELEERGIITKNIAKAEEVIQRLHRDLALNADDMTPIEPDEAPQLMRCIVAGRLDQLWVVNDKGNAEHIFTSRERELSGSSVVRNPRLIAATPFDLEVPTHSGLQTLHLVTEITAVNTDWLIELSPELFSTRKGKIEYDPREGTLVERQQVRIGKRVVQGSATPLLDDTKENQRQFVRGFTAWALSQLERQQRNLSRYHKRVPRIRKSDVEQAVKQRASGIVALDQLGSQQKRELLALAKMETYLGDEFAARLGAPRSHHGNHHHKRRKGWQPKHKRSSRRDSWR